MGVLGECIPPKRSASCPRTMGKRRFHQQPSHKRKTLSSESKEPQPSKASPEVSVLHAQMTPDPQDQPRTLSELSSYDAVLGTSPVQLFLFPWN